MTVRFLFKLNKITFLLLLSGAPGIALADDAIDFDTTTLQARGLSPSLNKYFRDGKKFTPGITKITPVINGVEKPSLAVTFDENGQPCLHLDDLTTLGIKAVKHEDGQCINLIAAYPQATITADPGNNKLLFVLPAEAIADNNNLDISQYTVGGTGAMVNYDLLMMKSNTKSEGDSDNNNLNTFQSNTEEGFNYNDWIVRSRQSFSSSDNSHNFDQLYTYAQRTLADYKAVMQAGKISIASSLFSTPQIYGVQFSPESALVNNKNSGASVTGIAQSQSRVEVRQAGALVYSTQVPAGAFTLDRIPTLNNTADLNVNIIGQDGTNRSFIVPASSFAHSYTQQETSFSGAIGAIDKSNNDDIDSSELMTLSMSTPVGKRAMMNGGALLAQNYQSMAGQLSTGFANGLSISGTTVISKDTRSQTNGVQGNINVSMQVTQLANINSSVTLQNNGFRSLTDGETTTDPDTGKYIGARYKSQYNLGLGYLLGDMGSVNLAWSRATLFDPAETTTRWTASWSKTFIGGTSISVNAEQDTGKDGDSLVYASISIPFGSARVGYNMSHTSDHTNQGVTLDQTINERLGYSLSANKDSRDDVGAFSANVHALPKYSQVNLGYSRYGSDSNTYSVAATGGVVATKQGVLFSPYPVQDTFAVVKLPDISGGEIDTPQGPVWTNSKGYAVSSGMNAYGESRLTLVTKSLPKNVDINNGIQVAHVARGSVTDYTFGTVLTRRALITIHMPNGKLANKGDIISDAKDNYITTVAGDGTVFLIDGQLEQELWLKPMGSPRCHVVFNLNKQPEADKLYESYDAQCKN